MDSSVNSLIDDNFDSGSESLFNEFRSLEQSGIEALGMI